MIFLLYRGNFKFLSCYPKLVDWFWKKRFLVLAAFSKVFNIILLYKNVGKYVLKFME